ncbi:LIM-domain binding protein-domain-containing protein [Xylaria nigripes]|nr:LIM-domain binding protein-domain-containing protein [Xylaria nigripes]
MQLGEYLSSFPSNIKGEAGMAHWQGFVDRFFSLRGIFRVSLPITGSDNSNEEHGTDKSYEVVQPAIARYFHTHIASGVRQVLLTFGASTVDRQLPNGCHFIENPKASMILWFDNSHVVSTGHLKALFDSEQKIDVLEYAIQTQEEYVSRKMVINAARPTHLWAKEWKKVNGQDPNTSPEMNKKGKARQMKSPPNPPPDFVIPHSAVKGNMSITEPVFQFLEIVEVMGQMHPLFHYFQTHPGLSPYQALEQYVNATVSNSQPPAAMNGHTAGAIPPTQRTPSFSQFPLGASPAASHLQLPNSPHMGSPAQGHMQAPGMQLQQSQQGTSSSGPSANTSPASNKRRRPSTVKAEEDSGAPTPASLGAPQVNGVAKKNPPTPRMQHNKRQKANPA